MVFKAPSSSSSVWCSNHRDLVVCENSHFCFRNFFSYSPFHGLEKPTGNSFLESQKSPDPSTQSQPLVLMTIGLGAVICRAGKLVHGGPEVFVRDPVAVPTQIRLAVGTHRSDQMLPGWDLSKEPCNFLLSYTMLQLLPAGSKALQRCTECLMVNGWPQTLTFFLGPFNKLKNK